MCRLVFSLMLCVALAGQASAQGIQVFRQAVADLAGCSNDELAAFDSGSGALDCAQVTADGSGNISEVVKLSSPDQTDLILEATGNAGGGNPEIVFRVNGVDKWKMNINGEMFPTSNGLDDFGSGINSLRNLFSREVYTGVVSKSTSFAIVVGSGDELIVADGSGTIITLPLATSSARRKITILRNDPSNAIVVEGNGADTINGALNVSLNSNYSFVEVQCDGTEWFIRSTNDALTALSGLVLGDVNSATNPRITFTNSARTESLEWIGSQGRIGWVGNANSFWDEDGIFRENTIIPNLSIEPDVHLGLIIGRVGGAAGVRTAGFDKSLADLWSVDYHSGAEEDMELQPGDGLGDGGEHLIARNSLGVDSMRVTTDLGNRWSYGVPEAITLGAAATAIDPNDKAGAVEITSDVGNNTVATITSTGFVEGMVLQITVGTLPGTLDFTDTASPGADQLALAGNAAMTLDSVLLVEFQGTYWREISRSLN